MRPGAMKSLKLQPARLRLAGQSARCKDHPNQEPAAQALVCSLTTLDRGSILMTHYTGSNSNCASSSGVQQNASRPQSYQLDQPDRSQTPRPSDYAQPYTRAPPSVTESAPAPTQPIAPQLPTPPYRPVSPSGDAVSNENGGLRRAGSLFRTASVLRHDHGEQLPAFTDVALPEEMVPQDLHQQHTGPSSPPAPRSPPPPHTFTAPLGPPSPLHNVRAQVGSTSPPLIIPQSPPPPHTFPTPSSPPSSRHSIRPPPPPPLVSSPLSLSPAATAPSSPIHSDPPPAFIPSNRHFPTPEKSIPYVPPQPGNPRVMSNPMSIYNSANRTYTRPTMKFDLDTAYGRNNTSPGPPPEGASLYR